MSPRIAVPGETVGTTATLKSGAGTFVEEASIVACLVGEVSEKDGVVSVSNPRSRPAIEVGTVVLGSVSRVNQTQVNVDLIAADDKVLDYPARAALRREDAVPAGQDPTTVNFAATFSGQDLVKAVVTSVDDKLRYHVAINVPGMGRVDR